MSLVNTISDSGLWRACKRLGIGDQISRTYSGLAFRYVETFCDGKVVANVAGYQACFRVSSPLEYRRAKWALGEGIVIEQLLEDLRPGDVFYDIGANVGTYACLCSRVCNHVVGFEPVPENYNRLRENLALNAPDEAWTVVPVALSDASGSITMECRGDRPGSGAHRLSESGELRVKQAQADELVDAEGLPLPDIVKIDVEGAERRVLQGMTKTLSAVRTLYCEVHREELDEGDVAAIKSLLDKRGFSTERVHDRGDTYYLRAYTPPDS